MNYKVEAIIVKDENGIHALFGFDPKTEKYISEIECESSISDFEYDLDAILADIKAELES